MRLLRSDDVDALASVELGIEAARKTAELVPSETATGRVQVADPLSDDEHWMRVLVGIAPALGVVGYKEFHRVGKRVRYHVSLFDHESGDAIGIVDGRRITSLRTASTAALAHRHVIGSGPVRIGVVGSGEEAREGLRAVVGTGAISAARIFSPTQANREALAEWVSGELGIEAAPAASAEEAMDGAGSAYLATAARAPVLGAGEVAGLRFVAAVGATRPDHHELRGDAYPAAAEVVVDCHDATEEPGDSIEAVSDFGWDPASAKPLGRWLAGEPANGDGPVLFKSIGSVEQDLVLALELLRAGEEQGLGEVIEPIGSLREMR